MIAPVRIIRSKHESPEGINDVQAYQVACDFLTQLHKEIALSLLIYANPTYDTYFMPYETNERGMDAVFLPALSKLCNGLVLTELSVIRKYRKLETIGRVTSTNTEHSSGRVDYWCIYKGYSFVIELKHCCLKSVVEEDMNIKNGFKDLWGTMVKQLKTINGDLQYYDEKTKGVIRVGVQLTTLQVQNKKWLDAEKTLKHPATILACLEGAVRKNMQRRGANYSSLWKIDSKLSEQVRDHLNLNHRSYALAMLGCIFDPIIHQGAIV